jgi:hypothetical protein
MARPMFVGLMVWAMAWAPLRAAGETEEGDVVRAMDRALDFLAQRQDEAGAIHEGKNKTAMTALALMAFMAAGHLPMDPSPEGVTVRKGLTYVLDANRQEKDGYYGKDGSRMYGHGITTLLLAETLGMAETAAQDALIRERLEKAVALILRAQQAKPASNRAHFGGWRYQPDSKDSDLSVTAWQVLALRAAQNAAIEVPGRAIEDAVRYIKITCEAVPAFRYQPSGHPTFTSAAYGLLSLQVCGEYEAPEVSQAAQWLDAQEVHPRQKQFYYGTYYYAQGMYQRGGELAERAHRRVVAALLPLQKPDGGWDTVGGYENEGGRVYATSMAVLALAVRCHYLPIYQR